MRAAGRSEDLSAAAIRKVEGGFPHSEIPGSKLVRSSPRLIAAYHVLHRLSAPRHPPNALKALDRSRDRCPLTGSRWKRMSITTRSQKDQWQIRFRTHHRMLSEHDRKGWQISLPQRPHSLFTMSLMSSPNSRPCGTNRSSQQPGCGKLNSRTGSTLRPDKRAGGAGSVRYE